jgi:hypothetical protein
VLRQDVVCGLRPGRGRAGNQPKKDTM